MNKIRKWSRILHRDFGYFFIGTTLIYAISGIALNHLHDWNPNYTVSQKEFKTETNLEKNENLKENVAKLVNEIAPQNELKKYYFPQENFIKIFLDGGSSIVVNTKTGEGQLELLQKRLVF